MIRKVIVSFFFTTTLHLLSFTQDLSVLMNQKIVLDTPLNFSFLDSIIGDKKIVVLGEAGHGDGKTFEVKSEIVTYLNKHKGFNVIALEGSGIFDMELFSKNIDIGAIENYNYDSWGDTWARVWSFSKETEKIRSLIQLKKIKAIGIEANTTTDLANFSAIIRYFVPPEIHSKVDFLFLDTLTQKIFAFNSELKISNSENRILKKQLRFIRKATKKHNEYEIINQFLRNYEVLVKRYRFNWFIDEGIDKGIPVRDKQMFKNLLFYIKRNPSDKIIVWTANFHGARNIHKINYKDGQPNIYEKFKLLGDFIYRKFRDKSYSMAFSSSDGTKGMYFQSPVKIVAPKGTLEDYLHQTNSEYVFIPFNRAFSNLKFRSLILGYDNKQGYWTRCFDGVFYLRKNHKATYVGD